MNIEYSIIVLEQMLSKYPKDGNTLFSPKREALKTAIKVLKTIHEQNLKNKQYTETLNSFTKEDWDSMKKLKNRID